MIIISNKTGQLANRLFAFSHVISNSIEHDIPVLNLNFQEYSPYFKATKAHDFGPYKIKTRASKSDFWNKFLNICITVFVLLMLPIRRKGRSYELIGLRDGDNKEVDLSAPETLELSKNKRLFIRGWGFWDKENIVKHRNEISELFQLVSPHKENVEELIESSRKKIDVLVGLHIRAGDYRTWQGGKYFYETEVYVQKAKKLASLFAEQGKKAGFIICSNEKQDLALFSGLTVFKSTDHFIEDLYTLSHCDYIMGPPSTYSLWASYCGKKPYLHLKNASQSINLADFKVKAD